MERPGVNLVAGVPRSAVNAAGAVLMVFWVGTLAALFGRLAWRYPLFCTGFIALVVSVFWMGFWGPINLMLIVGILGLLWSALHDRSYRFVIGRRLRSEIQRATVYGPRWNKTMLFSGLAMQHKGRVFCPKLKSVRSTEFGDRIEVGMVVGQSPADFEARIPELETAFAARSVRIWVPAPGRLVLDVVHIEPLAVPFVPPPIPEVPYV